MDHSYLTEEQVISDTAVQIRDLPAKGRTYMNKLAEIEMGVVGLIPDDDPLHQGFKLRYGPCSLCISQPISAASRSSVSQV